MPRVVISAQTDQVRLSDGTGERDDEGWRRRLLGTWSRGDHTEVSRDHVKKESCLRGEI